MFYSIGTISILYYCMYNLRICSFPAKMWKILAWRRNWKVRRYWSNFDEDWRVCLSCHTHFTTEKGRKEAINVFCFRQTTGRNREEVELKHVTHFLNFLVFWKDCSTITCFSVLYFELFYFLFSIVAAHLSQLIWDCGSIPAIFRRVETFSQFDSTKHHRFTPGSDPISSCINTEQIRKYIILELWEVWLV